MPCCPSRRADPKKIREELTKAVARINNLALVHDRLQMFTTTMTTVDAAAHFQDLCGMLRSLLPPGVSLSSKCSGTIPGADAVESLTLIANELVTNAAIRICWSRQRQDRAGNPVKKVPAGACGVADDGPGLPPGHEFENSARLLENYCLRHWRPV